MVVASGVRIGWADLPGRVRDDIERIVGGGPVVAAETQAGGFSPGTADRVRTAGGRRAFVKAVTPALNADSAAMARNELRISSAMPPAAPVPRVLGGFDDGEWVVLVLEDVAGAHPRTPWVEGEIRGAAAALRDLATVLTPSPIPDLPAAAERLAPAFGRWRDLAGAPPGDLDPWAARRLDALRETADRGIAALSAGRTVVHADLRADNILIRPDGRFVFVDWPWGCTGPDWLDSVLLAINVIVHGGDPGPLLDGIDPAITVGIVSGAAAYFHHMARLPPPPGLPTVRAFQRFQGESLLPWLRAALDG
ncbi:aminoglycoside phosphotransferase family protein [Actinoplanes sp. NPDC023801]|uniref:aminoglycoside phosphotransferase family protein n=1 Tax=Actinoplanes sp. NPDC023801 TaxID=3154595 RepID=UPI0033E5D38A